MIEEGWRVVGGWAPRRRSIYLAAFDYLDGPLDQVLGEDVAHAVHPSPGGIPDTAPIMTAVRQFVGRASIQEGAAL